jgi:hypothetical protein
LRKIILRPVFFFALVSVILLSNMLYGADINKEKKDAKGSKEGYAFFEKHVRPLLVDNCYKCHSEEAHKKGKLKGELFLDSAAGLMKGGEGGPAIVPGDPKESMLIKTVRHLVQDYEMPPKGRKLSDEKIMYLEKWIKMGAPDPRKQKLVSIEEKVVINYEERRKFWSFKPLMKVKAPTVENKKWVKNAVDQFILKKLESQRIRPVKPAERRVLIRRIYFGLLGLSPSYEEVKAFEQDKSDRAYDSMVDRLLENKHFGERWARHWLDLARFAESNGYAFDGDRKGAFQYRDFVIKAFNDDMPYDEFIHLQIAGDLIKPKDVMTLAATGFISAGPFTSQQTMKERERSRYEQLDDVVSTVGTSMLGMTVGCARCHDHKYDPISTRDYYSMLSAFEKVGFKTAGIDENPHVYKNAIKKFKKKHEPYVATLISYQQSFIADKFKVWEKQYNPKAKKPVFSKWKVLGPFSWADFNKGFATDYGPEKKIDLKASYQKGKYKWVDAPKIKDNHDNQITEEVNLTHYYYRTIHCEQSMPFKFGLKAVGLKFWINGKIVINSRDARRYVKATVLLKKGVNHVLIKVASNYKTSLQFDIKSTDNDKSILSHLKIAPDKRNKKQLNELYVWYAKTFDDATWKTLKKNVDDHMKTQPKADLTSIFSAAVNGPTYNFKGNREIYHLVRGNSNAKLDRAKPGFMKILSTSPLKDKKWLTVQGKKTTEPRLAFAHWLTDTKEGAGHLVARVIVNRLWKFHFGRGIVGTTSDFGVQGEKPTHPELLDFLANKLIEDNWKLKNIHRLILKSAAYQLGGQSDVHAEKVDPGNRLWWRRDAIRLEGEIVRDNLLNVSGKLDKTMYGPGFLKLEMGRRSVYMTVKRSQLVPFLQLFDAPDTLQGMASRNISTTAPQSLTLINSPFVREQANLFSKRIQKGKKLTDKEFVMEAYKLAFSRLPDEQELKHMLTFITSQTTSYKDREKALADFSHLLLCSNEFVFID